MYICMQVEKPNCVLQILTYILIFLTAQPLTKRYEMNYIVMLYPLYHVLFKDNYPVIRPEQVPEANESLASIENIVSAAARLANKPDAVDWLPEARGMQLIIIATNQSRLQRAKALLQLLETPEI